MANTGAQVHLIVTEEFVPDEGKNMFTVYCPELSMGGMGATKEEAEKNFQENLKMAVDMAKVIGLKELDRSLTSFGWMKKDGQWTPPQLKMSVEKITITL